MARLSKEYALSILGKIYLEGAAALANASSLAAWRSSSETAVILLFGSDHDYTIRFRQALRRIDAPESYALEAHERSTVVAIRVGDALSVIEQIIGEVERNGVPCMETSLARAWHWIISLKSDHPLVFFIMLAGSLASIASFIIWLLGR